MTADAIGGVWTYCIELIRALKDHKVNVTLATMGALPGSSQMAEIAELPNADLRTSRFKLEWMEEPWSDVDAAGEWLQSLARQVRPGVIHLNGYAHANLAWPAPVLVVAHSCVATWWQGVHGKPVPNDWATYLHRVRLGLHAAELVVAPSRAFLEDIIHHHGKPKSAQVIYNARSPSETRSTSKEPLVFAAGRLWDQAKNIRALAGAAPKMRWPVFIAGDASGPEGAPCRFPGVHCLGQLPRHELQAWFDRASIYALPALYEPFGLSILEAAQSGAALVLGDIPTLREIWEDAALFIDPRDTDQLADAVNGLAADPDRRSVLARRAFERAGRYAPCAMAEAYAEAYGRLQQNYRQTSCDSFSSITPSFRTGTTATLTS